MKTAIQTRCTAAILAVMVTVGTPLSFVAAQPYPEAAVCGAAGLRRGVDIYLPALPGWVIVSDERRNAEQLAATFPDPTDALSRLHAWCWDEQAERVYTADRLTVDVSIHQFTGTAGPMLAQRWFAYQRANGLGLKQGAKTQTQLEGDLNEGGLGRVNIEALDALVIMAFYNDNEYTLYGRRNPDDRVIRVSVSGDPSVGGRSREVMAYWVLAQVLRVDLFPPRE